MDVVIIINERARAREDLQRLTVLLVAIGKGALGQFPCAINVVD